MLGKIEQLEKQLTDKQVGDSHSEYERQKRETKEEAGKVEVNIDILHSKLILLESLARNANHPDKEKLSMLLSRFHVHKGKPSFVAAFVLKNLSTKEEELILDREQKLIKAFGIGNSHTYTASNDSPMFSGSNLPGAHEWSWGSPSPGPVLPMPHPQRMSGPPHFQRRGGYQRFRFHQQSPSKLTCFRCQRLGHLVRDCPLNMQ
ncbi:MAG: zinc finger CCHC domain-containing protein [Sedimenticola sp.]